MRDVQRQSTFSFLQDEYMQDFLHKELSLELPEGIN